MFGYRKITKKNMLFIAREVVTRIERSNVEELKEPAGKLKAAMEERNIDKICDCIKNLETTMKQIKQKNVL